MLIKTLKILLLSALFSLCLNLKSYAGSRIKDIADFEGIRDNLLIGYGLVVGLNGTGDDIGNIPFAKESLIAMLERLGVNTRGNNIDSKNIAAVTVTANLPGFAKQGSKIDVTISALGDCSSLLGGTLLVTPLYGADGEVYAVTQGQVAVGGFSAKGQAESFTKGVPTSGRIANGAIIEREINFNLSDLETVKVSLRNPDLTTSLRVSEAINAYLGEPLSKMEDPSTISLKVPDEYKNNVVGLLTSIEQLKIEPDMPAVVVIDEQSGTIVMGEDVKINKIAIAQGNLTIRITETPQVSQPLPFSEGGSTISVPRTEIDLKENQDKKLEIVDTGVNLRDLVNGLNALGIGPRDMIGILQAIKASGALQADIKVM